MATVLWLLMSSLAACSDGRSYVDAVPCAERMITGAKPHKPVIPHPNDFKVGPVIFGSLVTSLKEPHGLPFTVKSPLYVDTDHPVRIVATGHGGLIYRRAQFKEIPKMFAKSQFDQTLRVDCGRNAQFAGGFLLPDNRCLTVRVLWANKSASRQVCPSSASSSPHTPSSIRLSVRNQYVSEVSGVAFEQLHIDQGSVVVSTTSTTWLRACPGAGHGLAITRGAGSFGGLWTGCIRFRYNRPARVPEVMTSNQHFAVAVLAEAGRIRVQLITIDFPAMHDGAKCYSNREEIPCLRG